MISSLKKQIFWDFQRLIIREGSRDKALTILATLYPDYSLESLVLIINKYKTGVLNDSH